MKAARTICFQGLLKLQLNSSKMTKTWEPKTNKILLKVDWWLEDRLRSEVIL